MKDEVRLMDWETYREWTRTTVAYPKEKEEEYLMVGLANEVGELLGKYKKEIRGDGEKFQDKIDELGDVCWYIARLMDHYGLSHQEVLHRNFSKLVDRQNRGVIKGDGDKR
jgi:NTP pyrophosphatase (non-canonical NTP hydrolase)